MAAILCGEGLLFFFYLYFFYFFTWIALPYFFPFFFFVDKSVIHAWRVRVQAAGYSDGGIHREGVLDPEHPLPGADPVHFRRAPKVCRIQEVASVYKTLWLMPNGNRTITSCS
jgi:hypothetical protein